MDAIRQFFAEQSRLLPNAAHMPSYKVLELVITAGIDRGLWKAGDALLPERKLAELCQLSVGTVKRAMLELVHQGKLYRRQGSGTYVAGPSFTRQNRRYYLFLRDFGAEASPNAVTLHSVNRVPAAPEMAAHLQLSAGEELFEVVRLFAEDGAACVLGRSYFSASRFARLDAVPRKRFENVPLFLILEDDYNVSSGKADELFGVAAAREEDAELLAVPVGAPLLLIQSLVYTSGGQPFEYRRSLCRTDKKYIYRSMG